MLAAARSNPLTQPCGTTQYKHTNRPGEHSGQEASGRPTEARANLGHRNRPKRSPPARRCLSSRAGTGAGAGAGLHFCFFCVCCRLQSFLKGLGTRIASGLATRPLRPPASTRGAFAPVPVLRPFGLHPVLCAVQHKAPDDLVAFPRCSGRKMPQCTTGPSQNPINGAAGPTGFWMRTTTATIVFARILKVRKTLPALDISHHRQHLCDTC